MPYEDELLRPSATVGPARATSGDDAPALLQRADADLYERKSAPG